MDKFITYWQEYMQGCKSQWEKETERVRLINEENLRKNKPGFVFPDRKPENTPSFEGFMTWLIENRKEI